MKDDGNGQELRGQGWNDYLRWDVYGSSVQLTAGYDWRWTSGAAYLVEEIMDWIIDIIVEVAKCIFWLCFAVLIGFGVAYLLMEVL